MMYKRAALWVVFLLLHGSAWAQDSKVVFLTMDKAVELSMGSSYQVRQLKMGIEVTRSWLRAQRAGLKSQVYMNVTTPEIESVSDNKWNSELQRDEIVHENTRLWRMDLAVRQPVILFGYPTNGYLSLNNTVYRYTQVRETDETLFYNRYYIRYDQPFFQPNHLKNALEQATLNLENEELTFQENVVNMLRNLLNDYNQLYRIANRQAIYNDLAANLEAAIPIARQISDSNQTRLIDLQQIQVELANAQEQAKAAASDYRIESSRLKRQLGLAPEDSIVLDQSVHILSLAVDPDKALQYAMTLRPRMRKLEIRERQDEIDLSNQKGNGAFRANLELTYGREKQDPKFGLIWQEPRNSYTVGLRAYVPIWDWGQRRARIQAEQIASQRTQLYIEEANKEIQSELKNAIQNLNEYQQRALTMQKNLEMAREISKATLQRYSEGSVGVLELLQAFNRQQDTADNFADAYLGYQRAIFNLQQNTYYDFERDTPLFERFKLLTSSGTR